MSLEEKLKKLIISRYGNVKAFAEHAGIKYTTLAAIMKRGIRNSTIENVFSLCHALNISVDALAEGKIIELPQNDMPDCGRVNDLPDLINAYVSYFESNYECTLDDQILTAEEMNYFIEGINYLFDQMRTKRYLAYSKRMAKQIKDNEEN